MLKKLLALVMSLCIVVGMGTTVVASETDLSSGNGFYVITEEVPQQVIEHVNDEIDFIHSNDLGRSTPSSKYLPTDWAETQSGLPWCLAYATACIMRYKTGHDLSTISARSVMEWAYPDLSKTELESRALEISQADDYANTYWIDPTYTASRATYSQIVSEINAYSPVVFVCDNVNTGAKKSHAFVCRGYNDNNGNPYYSVWNPWYSKYEKVYSSDNTYVNTNGTAKYLWSATMYGWR